MLNVMHANYSLLRADATLCASQLLDFLDALPTEARSWEFREQAKRTTKTWKERISKTNRWIHADVKKDIEQIMYWLVQLSVLIPEQTQKEWERLFQSLHTILMMSSSESID